VVSIPCVKMARSIAAFVGGVSFVTNCFTIARLSTINPRLHSSLLMYSIQAMMATRVDEILVHTLRRDNDDDNECRKQMVIVSGVGVLVLHRLPMRRDG
jgi:hypothetical protein